jgi:drug/metabolite transporter (DMT)-like permease
VTDLAARAAPAGRSTHARGLALVAAAAVVWSTGGLIVRSLDVDDEWTIIAYRSLFATLFLAGAVVVRERRGAARAVRRMGAAGLLVGACFTVASIAFVVALGRTSVANTLVIVSTAPLAAAILGRIVLRDPVRPRTWAATAATLVGVIVLASGSSGATSRAGDAIAMLIPVALATATVTIRRHEAIDMIPAMGVGTALAFAVAAPLAGSWSVAPDDLALLVVFGALQLGGGLALYAVGARLAPPADVALVALVEPVLAPLWVWAFAGESPGGAAVVGGAVVLGAMAVHTVLDLRSRPVPPAV